jgi:hypothetical protein
MEGAEEPANKKSHLDWKALNGQLTLATAVCRHSAHKRTKGGPTLESKYLLVAADFTAKTQEPSNPKSLQAQFWRAVKQTRQRYAIDFEGANLSGLPDDVPDVDRLLLDLAIDAEKAEV